MTRVHNNFDGGPDQTTITTANSGQFGNNAFDSVASGANILLQFIAFGTGSYNRPTAEFGMGFSTVSGGPAPWVAWTTSMGTQAEVWTRIYMYFESVGANATDLSLCGFAGSGGQGVGLWLRTTTTPYALQIRDVGASGTVRNTMTTPVTAAQWHRVEFHAHRANGASELYYYAYPDTDTDTNNYTETISQTGGNYGTSAFNQFVYGETYVFQPSQQPVYYSGLELNNTGYPGPSPFRQGLGVPMNNQPNSVAIHMA